MTVTYQFLNFDEETLKHTPSRNTMMRLAVMMKMRCGEPHVLNMAFDLLTKPTAVKTSMEYMLKASGFFALVEDDIIKACAYVISGSVIINFATMPGAEGKGYGKQLLWEMAERWTRKSESPLYSPVEPKIQEFFQKAGWVYPDTHINTDGTRDMCPPGLVSRYNENSNVGGMDVRAVGIRTALMRDGHLWAEGMFSRDKIPQKGYRVE